MGHCGPAGAAAARKRGRNGASPAACISFLLESEIFISIGLFFELETQSRGEAKAPPRLRVAASGLLPTR